MTVLKNHEWKYLKSSNKDLFLAEICGGSGVYFIHLDEEAWIEKGAMNPPDPKGYALASPEVEKNVIEFGKEEEKVQLGYTLKWNA